MIIFNGDVGSQVLSIQVHESKDGKFIRASYLEKIYDYIKNNETIYDLYFYTWNMPENFYFIYNKDYSLCLMRFIRLGRSNFFLVSP
uniref:Uncharacterized protein n=1 Tax=Pertusaria plittiana TaxID=394545 RepID=A0A2P1M544_9LECA|nr:hypothetical protein [Pertusaria plittiana]